MQRDRHDPKLIELFNNKPEKAIEQIKLFCQENNKNITEEIALFFFYNHGNLNLVTIGDYLTRVQYQNILEYFISKQEFQGKSFINALEEFLKRVRFPQEEEKFTKLAEKFAYIYCQQNPKFAVKDWYVDHDPIPDMEIKTEEDVVKKLVLHTMFLNKYLNKQNISEENKKWIPTDIIRDFNLQEHKLGIVSKQLDSSLVKEIFNDKKIQHLKFDSVVPGCILKGRKLEGDKTYQALIRFLKSKKLDGATTIFPKLESIQIFHPTDGKEITWKNFFSGYQTKITATDPHSVAEIHISIPSFLKRFFLKKPEVKICPISNNYAIDELTLAAKIAAQFQSPIKTITNYPYEQDKLEKVYKEEKAKFLGFPNIKDQSKNSEAKILQEVPKTVDQKLLNSSAITPPAVSPNNHTIKNHNRIMSHSRINNDNTR